MTVLDTSAAVDYLLGAGAAEQVGAMLEREGELAAPDLLVFETLAVLRRGSLAGTISDARAAAAVEDLGELPIELFPSLPLRARAWSLCGNLTAADAPVRLAGRAARRAACNQGPRASRGSAAACSHRARGSLAQH